MSPPEEKKNTDSEDDFFDSMPESELRTKSESKTQLTGESESDSESDLDAGSGLGSDPIDRQESISDDSLASDPGSSSNDQTSSNPSSEQSKSDKTQLVLKISNQYLDVASRLLMSPRIFFREMNVGNGFSEPVVFLGISSLASALLACLFNGFHFWGMPSRILFEAIAVLFLSAVTFMLSRSMGSKSSFEAVFKVFAYCSCMNVFGAIPGVGLLTPIYGLVLNYFGLRAVLQTTVPQTITVLAFALLMQLVLNIGRALSGH